MDLSFRDLGTLVDPEVYRNEWTPEMRLAHLLTFLERNPKAHDQSTWFETTDLDRVQAGGVFNLTGFDYTCGTRACAAGWTALFAGARPVRLEHPLTDSDPDEEDETRYVTSHCDLPMGEADMSWIESAASFLLGLVDPEHDRGAFAQPSLPGMFSPTIGIDDVMRHAEHTDTGRRMIEQGLWEPRGAAHE